jgi:hypothetical protein
VWIGTDTNLFAAVGHRRPRADHACRSPRGSLAGSPSSRPRYTSTTLERRSETLHRLKNPGELALPEGERQRRRRRVVATAPASPL